MLFAAPLTLAVCLRANASECELGCTCVADCCTPFQTNTTFTILNVTLVPSLLPLPPLPPQPSYPPHVPLGLPTHPPPPPSTPPLPPSPSHPPHVPLALPVHPPPPPSIPPPRPPPSPSPPSPASPPAVPPGTFFFSTLLGASPLNWTEAAAFCEGLGLALASIHSEAENAWVRDVCHTDCWIGWSDARAEQVWEWADGTAATYTNWAAGEPNGQAGEATDYAYMYVDSQPWIAGQWDDTAGYMRKPFVCRAHLPPSAPPSPPRSPSPSHPPHVPLGHPAHPPPPPSTPPPLSPPRPPPSPSPPSPASPPAVPPGTFFFSTLLGASPLNWTEAAAFCEGLGLALASIHSEAENAWVRDVCHTDCWIGWSDARAEQVWEWADGTAATYTNWAAGEPNGQAGEATDYAYMYVDSQPWIAGQWDDTAGYMRKPFVCRAHLPPSAPPSPPRSPSPSHPPHVPLGHPAHPPPPPSTPPPLSPPRPPPSPSPPSPASPPAVPPGTFFFSTLLGASPLNWTEAAAFCEGLGLALASIHSEAENAWVRDVCHTDCWIGWSDARAEQVWEWADGTAATYTNWAAGEPNGQAGEATDYAYMYVDSQPWIAGQWDDTAGYMRKPFVCRAHLPPSAPPSPPLSPSPSHPPHVPLGHPAHPPPPPSTPPPLSPPRPPPSPSPPSPASPPAVPPGTFFFSTLLGASPLNWTEAAAFCEGLGLALASIHSEAENAWVRDVCHTDCWIGWSDARAEQVWEWADGTAATYTNWAAGEPNGQAGEATDYAYMYVDSQPWIAGQWDDTAGYMRKPFVCRAHLPPSAPPSPPLSPSPSHPPHVPLGHPAHPPPPPSTPPPLSPPRPPPSPSPPSPASPPAVPPGTFFFSTLLGASPLNWTEAAAFCEGLGLALASIHSEAENAWVRDVCHTDCWIGWSDARAEQVWEWADGTAATYTNWAAGEPNGQAGEATDYAYMYVDSQPWIAGQWDDTAGYMRKPFVCRAHLPPSAPPSPPLSPSPSHPPHVPLGHPAHPPPPPSTPPPLSPPRPPPSPSPPLPFHPPLVPVGHPGHPPPPPSMSPPALPPLPLNGDTGSSAAGVIIGVVFGLAAIFAFAGAEHRST
ncbi:hypothetical protein AB1Y20_012857 [Prymnesium parvum]|uniref:C-type lectin domain-containing protein n=1 Tax=Prymnesium parvum TaxID=97485 RepID=A0AB34IMJ7_PRYPA